MEKTLFEQMGGTYRHEGNYLLPNLTAPQSVAHIGIWGQRRRDYLKRYRKPIYTGLLLSGKLDTHLAEVDRSAAEVYERLMAQMAKEEGVSEKLKATDQMTWVGRMNNIRSRAVELVNAELITV